MNNRLLIGLIYCSALGCGLVAGVFLAFSSFVMPALARLPAAQGIAAMQSINIAVINPIFLGVFFGTAVGCVALIVQSLSSWTKPWAAYLLAGGLLYLLGTLLVTILFNVPRNDALAAIDPNGTASANLWSHYVAGWTAWNHVRGAAAMGAAVSLMVALCQARTVLRSANAAISLCVQEQNLAVITRK
jgi:uncharacterized membrane protein